MTPRERVIVALEHREPDRAPIDLGTARFTTMVKPAYESLCRYLGIDDPEPAVVDRVQQIVQMDERVAERLGVDLRSLSQNAPDRGGEVEVGAGRYRDEWGVVRQRPAGSHYYDMCESPLAGEITAARIARYPWPDPTDPGRFRGLREKARALHQKTSYAVMYNARYNLVHQAQYMRGFEDWYCDLGQDHDLFNALMEAILENMLELNGRALKEVGDYVDVVAFGDDVGLEDRAVCSLPLYRKLIRPYQERIVAQIRAHTRAKILYHSCGSVYRLIPDFIEIGFDALNPVQVTAKDMEPARLKAEFGDAIAFWGGVDTRRTLPHGTPDDVRAEVRRLFEILGPGGGWVITSVHNIQPDVPPENVVALCEAGLECVYSAAAVAQ